MSTRTPRTSAVIDGNHFQWNCLFDCHPFLSVHNFDHNSAAALATVFEASIPEASYRFLCCGYVFSMDMNLSSSLCVNVSPAVCFLIMFLEDVLHGDGHVRDQCDGSSLPR